MMMLLFTKLFKKIGLLLVFVTLSAHAQQKVVEIDSITMLPNQQLPFDEPFVLKIPIKSQEVNSIYCFELKNRKNLEETINKRYAQNPSVIYYPFENSNYETVTIGKTRYLFVYVDAKGANAHKIAKGIDSREIDAADKIAVAANANLSKERVALAAVEARLVTALDAYGSASSQGAFAAEQVELALKNPRLLLASKAASETNTEVRKLRSNHLLDPGKSYTFIWSGNTLPEEVWEVFDQYRIYRTEVGAAQDAAKSKLITAYKALASKGEQKSGLEIAFSGQDIDNNFGGGLN